jgi:hypothetical protein
MCTRSWKAIEVIPVAASESATSLAWYSRTPRIRRGPNTNDCTTSKIWRNPAQIWVSKEDWYYRNDESWSHKKVSQRLTYRWEYWREIKNELEARNSNEATMSDPSVGKGNNSQNMNSPRKVKHMSLDQHRETVVHNPSWRMLSQFTEVFYRNPDC